MTANLWLVLALAFIVPLCVFMAIGLRAEMIYNRKLKTEVKRLRVELAKKASEE